ncbi:PilZ domain-containing protein, partial [Aquifex sp.]
MADFEPNYLRKTYRLKLPAEVIIEGKKFKVLDWSYEGFGIEKSPEDAFVEGKDYLVTFILPFASFHVSFKARAVLKWQTDKRAGFQFLKLSDEIKQMLRSYVEAYIEGRLE